MAQFEDETEGLLSVLVSRVRGIAVERFGSHLYQAVYISVFALTPEVPSRVWMTFHTPSVGRALSNGALLTFMFSFIFTVCITAICGTLLPDGDPSTIQFLEDWVNVILYLFVCPAYVALSFAMLGLAAEYWSRPLTISPDDRLSRPRLSRIRGTVALALVLFGSSVSISQYQFDLLSGPEMIKKYWFMQTIGAAAVLNRAGFWYIILNFALLCISALGALAYISLAVQAVHDARKLDVKTCIDIPEVISRFRDFEIAVVLARLLVVCYMFNVIIWSYSWLGKATVTNIAWTSVLIVIVGVVGTKLPSAYVRSRIAELRENCLAAGISATTLNLLPTRVPRSIRMLSSSFGALIGLGFLGLLSPVFDPSDWTKWVLSLVTGRVEG